MSFLQVKLALQNNTCKSPAFVEKLITYEYKKRNDQNLLVFRCFCIFVKMERISKGSDL